MNKIFKVSIAIALISMLAACGSVVEVPPAHVGKIMTKDGYQENLVPSSKFRLPWCFAYCDKLVLLDVSDKTKQEGMTIFMPEDKLNLDVGIQVTLSVNPEKTQALFNTIPPTGVIDNSAIIEWDQIYNTYAKQVIVTETREYLSQYSIAEVASSMEKVNSDLRTRLSDIIEKRTPFNVRYVGVTNVVYPKIITAAQENAAERRERIQQEEAQLEISRVTLQRELQETQLQRQIEVEKAQTEATAQRIQREVVDDKVLRLRELENQRLWIEKWDGAVPATMMTSDDGKAPQFLFQVPSYR
jgi:predicted small lipoprotein YifL